MAVSAGMELMKALATKLKRAYRRIYGHVHLHWWTRFVHPDFYQAHFEAVETLLRDIGYIDKSDAVDRTPYLKREADRLKELEKAAEALG
jgi:hypothetical protein